MNNIFKTAFINATGTSAYIALIATLIPNFAKFFPKEDPVLIPVFMLSLFVFSAAFTAGLVLGRPIIWYVEGKKREAISLFIYTLGIFFLLTLGIFTVMFLSEGVF